MVAFGGVNIGVCDLLHTLGQGVLGDFLYIDVDGGFHVVAGHRFLALHILLGDDGALLGDLIQTLAVDAVEVSFKGFLKAGFAHLGVHGVAEFFEFLPFGVGHGAHVA